MVVRGKTGDARSAVLPPTPDWMTDAVSIHSHNIFNDATQMSDHKENNIGDADHFGDYVQNVIVGPLGAGGVPGLAFYERISAKQSPIYIIDISTAKKIISQQFVREQRKIQCLINAL